jgi:hypothetical protein
MIKSLFSVGCVVLVMALIVNAAPTKYPADYSLSLLRPCAMLDNATPTRMQCQTGADADSGAMTVGEKIQVQCDTDAWWQAGSAAVTAVAHNTKLGAGVTYEFTTTDQAKHFSCLSVALNGDCRITRCQ